MQFIPRFLLLAILIASNGFFVASEVALIRVRKTRIDELVKKGNTNALRVQKALNNMGRYLSATQLGITLASLALGWIGEPIVASFIESFFTFLPKNTALMYAHSIALIVGFILITFIQILLGELVPKYIGLQKTERVALFNISFLVIFQTIFTPFISLLTITANFISKLIGLSSTAQKVTHTQEEIKIILTQSAESGMIDQQEVDLISHVFKFSTQQVQTIMIPRTDVIAFNLLSPLSDVIEHIKNYTHTRFLVYELTVNNIIGFIHIKDIYLQALKGDVDKKLIDTDLVKQVISVEQTTPIHNVLQKMRETKTHLAVVMNNQNQTVGIVTVENIVESIVGHIDEEIRKPLETEQKEFYNWG